MLSLTEQLFVQSIPQFVYNCEERVYNAVQIPAIRKNVIGNFTNGDNLPSPAQATIWRLFRWRLLMLMATMKYLIDKDVNFIRQSYPNPTTDTGAPRYYAQFQPVHLFDRHRLLMPIIRPSCTTTTTHSLSFRAYCLVSGTIYGRCWIY